MDPALRIARKMAAHSHHKQHRLGAVLIRGGNIISRGFNFSEVHAEKCAINRCWRTGDLRGTTLVVVRVKRNGTLGMALPCDTCMARIVKAGIKTVYYSDDKGEIQMFRVDSNMVDKYSEASEVPVWRKVA